MSPFRFAVAGIGIGTLGVLAVLGLHSPLAGGMAPQPDSLRPASSLLISPDPRWLDLIRTRTAAGVRLQSAIPSLHIHLTDRTVAGRMPTPAAVSVQVYRDGTLIAMATAQPFPDGDGYFYVATPAYLYPDGCGGICGCFSFRPGNEVRAIQGSTVISLTLPSLEALADPGTDTVSGTAPPSRTVTLYLYPRADPFAVFTTTADADPEGHYEATWNPYDLRPGDSGYAAWSADLHRAVYVRFVAPLLQVQRDGAEAVGMAAPCSSVRMTVTLPAGLPLGEWWGTTDPHGRFQAWLYWRGKGEGLPSLPPGARVDATAAGQTFTTVVLPLSVHADRDNCRVWGTAPPNATLRAVRFPGPLRYNRSIGGQWPTEEVTGTVGADGSYTLPLALAAADYGAVFVTGTDGHETFARFAVPYLFARLGPRGPAAVPPYNTRLWGQVDGVNIPITVVIQGPRGYIKDIRHPVSGNSGEFSDLIQDRDVLLETGDTLTVTTTDGIQAALTVPTLTVRTDPLSDTVSGEAPPHARLEVFIYAAPPGFSSYSGGGGGGPEYPVYRVFSRTVTATAEGTYVADFHGVADISPGSAGEVVLYLSEDTAVSRSFLPTACRPFLTHAVVGGNYLEGVSGLGCPSATVTLLDPAGQIKALQWVDFQYWTRFYLYLYLHEACPWPDECNSKSIPIYILPGDRIEIQSAGEAFTWTVPTLTLEIAPRLLSGQAPPNEPLTVQFWDDAGAYHRQTTTATAQGVYSVSLPGGIRPAPGELINVYWRSGETVFSALDLIPSLQLRLFGETLYGCLHPLIPYTVTPTGATGYAGPDGGISIYTPPLVPGERITVTTPREVLSLTVPLLTARIDRAAATVSGRSPPNAHLEVDLQLPYGIFATRRVTATDAGTYTVSFPEVFPFNPLYGVVAEHTPDGHRVSLHFAPRHWAVHLGDPCVRGYADLGGAPFTVTLRAGSEEETVTGTTWYGGEFSACFSRPIRPGDHLTLTQVESEMSITVPRLTAVHDWATQVLQGEASPGSLLQAVFREGGREMVRRTRADASGRYFLDTSDLSLQVGQTGYVLMTDEEGNTIQADFTVQGYRLYLPVVMRAGG